MIVGAPAPSSPETATMRRILFRAAALALLLTLQQPATAAIEIRFWHSMTGTLGERIEEAVNQFNASQAHYRVVASYHGDDAMGAAPGATSAGPHIIQAAEAATGTLLATRHVFRPVQQVMAEAGMRLDANSFYAPVAAYLQDHGQLAALPFNVTTPAFFYNKDAFAKAGLDPARAPRTWREVQEAALALRDAGLGCGYTTSWPAWIHLEHLSAWHDEPVATRANGFDGADAKLTFNGVMLIRHISLLSSWLKSRIFTYAGRANEGDARFSAGECGMLTTSSSAYADVAGRARFAFGVAAMPYYDEFPHAPHNSIPGGSALWVLSGKNASEYRGVAAFLAFLSRPEVQAEWHQRTSYLPTGPAVFELARQQGFYETRPGFEVFVKQLVQRAPSANSRGLRIRHLPQVRAILDEELEAVWNGRKTPKEALDEAVERGNRLLDGMHKARLR